MTSTEKKNRKEENSSSSTFKKVIQKGRTIPEESLELKAEEPTVRYLKLQPFHRQLQYGNRIVPELRLNGCWLEKAGFTAEKYVSVTVMDGLLIIRSAENMETSRP